MIDKEKSSWGPKLAAQFNRGNYAGMFDLLGQDIKGALQESIVDLQSPPLSPVTIALRLASYSSDKKPNMATIAKPLIFTSHMLNSAAFEVGND
jgi:hypothetical protein